MYIYKNYFLISKWNSRQSSPYCYSPLQPLITNIIIDVLIHIWRMRSRTTKYPTWKPNQRNSLELQPKKVLVLEQDGRNCLSAISPESMLVSLWELIYRMAMSQAARTQMVINHSEVMAKWSLIWVLERDINSKINWNTSLNLLLSLQRQIKRKNFLREIGT